MATEVKKNTHSDSVLNPIPALTWLKSSCDYDSLWASLMKHKQQRNVVGLDTIVNSYSHIHLLAWLWGATHTAHIHSQKSREREIETESERVKSSQVKQAGRQAVGVQCERSGEAMSVEREPIYTHEHRKYKHKIRTATATTKYYISPVFSFICCLSIPSLLPRIQLKTNKYITILSWLNVLRQKRLYFRSPYLFLFGCLCTVL